MKTYLRYCSVLLISGLSILFSGCPMFTSYPLGEKGEVPLDDNLLGTWTTEAANAEAKRLQIEKFDANTYLLTIEESGPDSIISWGGDRYFAWLTKVGKHKFMVLQSQSSDTSDSGEVTYEPSFSYYAYEYTLESK